MAGQGECVGPVSDHRRARGDGRLVRRRRRDVGLELLDRGAEIPVVDGPRAGRLAAGKGKSQGAAREERRPAPAVPSEPDQKLKPTFSRNSRGR